MKKQHLIAVAICGLTLFSFTAEAQSLKNLLNSSAVKDAVTAVTGGGKTLSATNLAGTWTYVTPTVKLESDNVLTNAAGTLATAEMKKKLEEICSKVGITKNAFNYTFNADSTFTSVIKGKTLQGTYSIDKANNTLELHYGRFENLRLTTLKAQPVITADQLSLLFEADKLLDFLSKISAMSDNTTLKTVSQLAQQYDGMLLGFELHK